VIAAFLFGLGVPAAAGWLASVGAKGRFAGAEAAAVASVGAAAAVVATAWFFPRRSRRAMSAGGACGGALAAGAAALSLASTAGGGGAVAAGEAAAVVFAFAALLTALGAPFSSLNRPEWAALTSLAAAAALMTTPWWIPTTESFVPPEMLSLNPWLRVVGSAGGVDWIRMAGLYPVVGAAYTAPVERTAVLVPWAALVLAGGGVALAVHRRRHGIASSGAQ
jgi:hypothetical protein